MSSATWVALTALLPWFSARSPDAGEGVFPYVPPSWDTPLNAPPVLNWMRPAPGPKASVSYRSQPGRPLVTDRYVFLGSAASDALYRLERADGSLVSTYPTSGPVMSEPVLEGTTLLFCDAAGYAWAYPVEGGPAVWSRALSSPCLSQPLVANGRVYIALIDNGIRALDLLSGELLWQYAHPPDLTRKSDLELFGAPSPARSGDQLITGFHDGRLVGLDVENGESRWERRVGEGRYPDIIGSPLVADGDVYVGGFSEPFVALDLNTRNVRWRLDVGSSSRCLRIGDTLYIPGVDGRMRAVDRITGSVTWEWDSTTTGSLTEPQATEAGLLVGSSDGGLWLVDPLTGTTRWTLEIGQILKGISTAPVVHGRQVVVYTDAGNILSLLMPSAHPGTQVIQDSSAFTDGPPFAAWDR